MIIFKFDEKYTNSLGVCQWRVNVYRADGTLKFMGFFDEGYCMSKDGMISLVSAKCCLLDVSFFVLVLALVLLASYCIVKMCEGHQAERDEVESLEKDFIRPKN